MPRHTHRTLVWSRECEWREYVGSLLLTLFLLLGPSPLCRPLFLPPGPRHLLSWKLGCEFTLLSLSNSCSLLLTRWETWSGTHGWASPRRTTTSRRSLLSAIGTWTRRRSMRSPRKKADMTTSFYSQYSIPTARSPTRSKISKCFDNLVSFW